MNEWVKKISPEIHYFLKTQGKEITGQIKGLLEGQPVKKADDNNDTSSQADAILNSVNFNNWATDLNALLSQLIYQIYMDGMEEAAKEVSGSFIYDPVYHQYANDYATQRAAELAGKKVLSDGTIIDNPNPEFALSDSTRQMLRSDLVDMMDQGMTPAEIASELENNYAFSESRATTIARTETGFTWNRGTIKMYGEAGVKMVYVTDGDYDESCRAVNGQVWSADYADAHALEHPNCTRSFAPCLEPDVQPDEY